MNMPGFNADSSLYKASKSQRWRAPHFNHSFGVQPQLRKTDYECVHDCLEAGGPESLDMCNFFCTENVDDGGGGGGGEQCRPGCGPCHSDPDSPTGRSQTCVRADCETYDRQCAGSRRPTLVRRGS
jgi:hypothetical protein